DDVASLYSSQPQKGARIEGIPASPSAGMGLAACGLYVASSPGRGHAYGRPGGQPCDRLSANAGRAGGPCLAGAEALAAVAEAACFTRSKRAATGAAGGAAGAGRAAAT